MRAVIQRVSEATVSVNGHVVGAIDRGLCVLLSVGKDDEGHDIQVMCNKVSGLRIFADDQGRMNLNVGQAGGQVLVISQFTLHGDVRRGMRPSFVAAMEPERARAMVERVCGALRDHGLHVEEGRFGADMEVRLCNQGPVTILIDTKKQF